MTFPSDTVLSEWTIKQWKKSQFPRFQRVAGEHCVYNIVLFACRWQNERSRNPDCCSMVCALFYIAMLSILHQPHTTGALRRDVFTKSTSWLRKPQYDATSPLQGMYNALTSAGHISPATPEQNIAVSRCLQHMSSVSLKDLGLQNYKFSKLACVSIVANQQFHIAAFLFPKGGSLPIHDHPKMAVFSKVIAGDLKVRAFTPTDVASGTKKINKNVGIPAQLVQDTVKTTQDEAWVITSKECNYHEFTALSDCVILDVLVPPYDHTARTCSYYSARELTNKDCLTSITGSANEATTSAGESHQKREYVLQIVPEEVVVRKYGLPVAIEYLGYVPTLLKYAA